MIWRCQGFRCQICSDTCKTRMRKLIAQGQAHYRVRDLSQPNKYKIRVLPSWAQGLSQSIKFRRCFICQKPIPDGRGGKRSKREYDGTEAIRPLEVGVKIVLQGRFTVTRYLTLRRLFYVLTGFPPNVKGQGKNCTFTVLGYRKTHYSKAINSKPFNVLESPCIWHSFTGDDVISRKWLQCSNCGFYFMVRELYRIEFSLEATEKDYNEPIWIKQQRISIFGSNDSNAESD